MKVGNITKVATFNSVFFNTLMRQTLSDDLWGLHKNMNCTFPLK